MGRMVGTVSASVESPQTIGFLAPQSSAKDAGRPEEGVCKPAEALFTFDSGRSISFAEGTRSTLVLGNTGSGKTRSVLLPMLDAFLRADFGGLVLDVKGNLGDQVRTLAKACGREDDIVEFGSGALANSMNLLAGLQDGQLMELFMTMSAAGSEHDSNVKWLYKGGRMAAEIAMVMKALSKTAKNEFARRFTPTLKAVSTLLNNRALAQGLWKYYCSELSKLHKLYMGKTEPPWFIRAQALYEEIQAQRFHVFAENINKTDTEAEQLSWMLQGITAGLLEIDTTKNLMARFSCLEPDAFPLDFAELIYRTNKVVLVHFDPSCGRAATALARVIKERFYASLYTHGLRLPEGKYTFMLGDEFQDIIDVSTNKLSDRNLFSVSREYKNINVIATQSVASLLSAGKDDAVDSLLANCTNKIFLQTRDPRTMEWTQKLFGAEAGVGELRQGECIIDTITWSGNPITRPDSVNDAFTHCRCLLGEKPYVRPRPKKAPPMMPLGLSGLPKRVEECLLARQGKDTKGNGGNIDIGMLDQMRQAANTCAAWWNIEKTEKPPRTSTAASADDNEAKHTKAARTRAGTMESVPKAVTEKQSNDLREDTEDPMPKEEQSAEIQEDMASLEAAERLRKNFPQFFPVGEQINMAIPPGWLPHVEKAFQGFAKRGHKLTIAAILVKHGALVVSATAPRRLGPFAYYQHTYVQIMNALLRGTLGLCALCGNPVAMPKSQKAWDDDQYLAVCDGCLAEFGLLLPGTGTEAGREIATETSENRRGK